jgi:hypothetical protein
VNRVVWQGFVFFPLFTLPGLPLPEEHTMGVPKTFMMDVLSPVWLITDDSGVCLVRDSNLGLVVPFFDDEDLAKTFVEQSGLPNLATLEVDTATLLCVLRTLETRVGVTHVGFNCDPYGKPNPRGFFFRIADVIATIATAIRDYLAERKDPPLA